MTCGEWITFAHVEVRVKAPGGRIIREMGVQKVTAGGQLGGGAGQVPGSRMRIAGIPIAHRAGCAMQYLSGAAQRDLRIKRCTRSPGGTFSRSALTCGYT